MCPDSRARPATRKHRLAGAHAFQGAALERRNGLGQLFQRNSLRGERLGGSDGAGHVGLFASRAG